MKSVSSPRPIKVRELVNRLFSTVFEIGGFEMREQGLLVHVYYMLSCEQQRQG